MLTIDEVARLALELPETAEGTSWGHRTWTVRGKGFAWERPFSKADIKRFGTATPPDGEIVAVRTEDKAEKAAVLAQGIRGVFDIEHFKAYPAVLVQLKAVPKKAFRELLLDGWLAMAPEALAREHLAARRRR